MRVDDLTGQKFGRLTALHRSANKGRRTQWKWRCDCGNLLIADPSKVKAGHTASCGCLWTDRCVKHRHGHNANGEQSRTYKAWVNMRSRVNPDIAQYWENYAARGISVCERWQSDFSAFLADMGECPAGKSLDRINNDGNYEPTNCRWASPSEQSANTRRTKLVIFGGQKMCIAEACRLAGVKPSIIHHRLNKGMTFHEAINLPVRRRAKLPRASEVLHQSSAWMIY